MRISLNAAVFSQARQRTGSRHAHQAARCLLSGMAQRVRSVAAGVGGTAAWTGDISAKRASAISSRRRVINLAVARCYA